MAERLEVARVVEIRLDKTECRNTSDSSSVNANSVVSSVVSAVTVSDASDLIDSPL